MAWTLFVMAGPFFVMAGPLFVMAGLGPAIHDFGWRNTKSWIPAQESQRKKPGGHDDKNRSTPWMPAPRTGMTRNRRT
jgi:hypothetical protein